ncbi:MAG: YqgE/AlgH family protein [Rhodospirillaceae bacterium]
MRVNWTARTGRRWLLAVVLAAVSGLSAGAAVDDSRQPPFASLAGRMLVATKRIAALPFAGTVIMIVSHTPRGAVGLVVNRPIGTHPIENVLAVMGMDGGDLVGTLPVHFGGPVGTSEGFVLHTSDYATTSTQFISEGLAMTSRASILGDILKGRGPKQSMFAFGYAGWGPGQLEHEIAQQAWITVPADEGIIFDEEHDTKWNRAMQLHGTGR